MQQKKCPQCKNLISVNAPTCLYCGRPNKFITKEYIRSKWKFESKNNKIPNQKNNKYFNNFLYNLYNYLFYI